MVIVLSVFNGFSDVAAGKLGRFEADFQITPTRGKQIAQADSLAAVAATLKGVEVAEASVAEQAFATAPERQMPVTLRGVGERTLAASGLCDITIDGHYGLDEGSAMLSVGVALGLGVRPGVKTDSITLYEPQRRGRVNPANPMGAFRSVRLAATGVYQVEQEEYDRDILLVPLAAARHLLEYHDGEASAIEVFLERGANMQAVRRSLEEIFPAESYRIADARQQQGGTFRMIAIEKWVTFLMLAFILLIAAANILASMSMLMLDKQPNMFILEAMGAPRRQVCAIFLWQSWVITLVGGLIGIGIGVALSLGQQYFGWIGIAENAPGTLAIDAYPVTLRWGDLPAVGAAAVAVAALVGLLLGVSFRKRLTVK